MPASEKPASQRRAIEEKIVALAWKDDGFRKAFLADPKKQFEERLGVRLPAELKMTAWQEDENSLHFVIPAAPKINLSELSDEDLEKVAGGIDAVMGGFIVMTVTALVGSASATAFANVLQEKTKW
jgi:hypothetical protein